MFHLALVLLKMQLFSPQTGSLEPLLCQFSCLVNFPWPGSGTSFQLLPAPFHCWQVRTCEWHLLWYATVRLHPEWQGANCCNFLVPVAVMGLPAKGGRVVLESSGKTPTLRGGSLGSLEFPSDWLSDVVSHSPGLPRSSEPLLCPRVLDDQGVRNHLLCLV